MTEGGPKRVSSQSDVYTILTIISTVFLLVGTVFVMVRAQQFFGSWLPLGR